uniref:(northern house mosquito) hypothetical protein n=2 Tax=Culex pipiens TaxID=7175 RepID=A0A8D8NY90_CULPI
MHQHSPIADDVLPADIGNHPVDVAGAAPARQVPAVYHDPGRAERRDHHYYPQHTLSQAEHSQDGTVGPEVLYTASTETAPDAGAKRFAQGIGSQQDKLRNQDQQEQVWRSARSPLPDAAELGRLQPGLDPAHAGTAGRVQRTPLDDRHQ